MRTVFVGLALSLCLAATAHAERRTFVVANDADGYGIDRCLASGEKCGAAAANAYCKMQAFAEAAMYHKIEHDEVTGSVSDEGPAACGNGKCNVIAIVCSR